MLHHPTLDKLQQLRLSGMHKALREQLDLPAIEELSFEERLGLLADRELTEREDRRLQTRLRQAKLRQNACLEDLDYRAPRGLDKALITQLATGQWVRDGLNVILLGPTGVGKTWIGCALGQHACRQGYTVRYLRLPRLFEELRLAHADGRFPKLMATLAKTDLLVLDDWGLTTWTPKPGATCWNCSTIAMASDQRSSPVSYRLIIGTRSSVIRPSPMRSSTAWCTTPIGSLLKANRCASAKRKN